MNTHTKAEAGLIAIVVAVVALAASWLPRHLGTGELVALVGIALLSQGVVREAWLRREAKKGPAPASPGAGTSLVASIAVLAVMVGGTLAALDRGGMVSLGRLRWAALAAVVFALGFALRRGPADGVVAST